MFYITNANYRLFLESLDINIPSYAKKEFYEGYKIKNFPLKRKVLTNRQKRILVISEMLRESNKNIDRLYFIRSSRDGNLPAYHMQGECESAHSDYNAPDGTLIKNSGVITVSEEMIKKIQDSIQEFDNLLEDIEPKYKENISSHLIDKFKLFRDYYSGREIDNSNADLEFHDLIFQLNQDDVISNENFDDILTKYCYLEIVMQFNIFYEKLKLLEKHKNKIFNDVLTLHYSELIKNGFDIKEAYLMYAGFKRCSKCFK